MEKASPVYQAIKADTVRFSLLPLNLSSVKKTEAVVEEPSPDTTREIMLLYESDRETPNEESEGPSDFDKLIYESIRHLS